LLIFRTDSGGEVVELGSHDKLIEIQGGAYAALVQYQQNRKDKGDSEDVRTSIQKLRHEKLSSSSRTFSNIEAAHSSRSFRSVSRGPSMRQRSPLQSFNSQYGNEVHPATDGKDGVVPGDEPPIKAPSFRRLLAMNRPEWKQAVLGSLGAFGYGLVQPLYAFFLGSMISTFYITDHDRLRRNVRTYSLIFVALAIVCFIVNLVQHYNFAAMGELLTKRIRTNMLSKILTFEVGWFDQDENSSGAVCSRLASEANVV
jgi:ATP-binding cassette subfamily B (MDR/TAP) protein 1